MGKITQKDRELIVFIGKFKLLTVSQLSALTQRSRQVLRRRIRFLVSQGLLLARERSYGNKQGRPEDLIFLDERDWELLHVKNDHLLKKGLPVDKSLDSIFIEHDLLLNWFLVHLIQVEREIPQLSVNFTTQNLAIIRNCKGAKAQIQKGGSKATSDNDFSEFIPDGVFTITNADLKKELLFFLEVDMGTETVASPKRDFKDIRQKITNYQALFRTGQYKQYAKTFNSRLNGFRLLFLTNTHTRLKALCRLTHDLPPEN
jgi:Replication-relaxation